MTNQNNQEPLGANYPSAELLVRLEAIVHPVRLQILKVLLASPDPCNTGFIADEVGRQHTLTSHHLGTLERAGLVLNTQSGKLSLWFPDKDHIAQTIESLKQYIFPTNKESNAI